MKPTYEDKINLVERYIQRPMAMGDPEILRAIKIDVVKAHSKTVKREGEQPAEGAEGTVSEDNSNAVYNKAMGIYREFLKSRDSHLDMTGRKAAINSTAMRGIINYIRGFAKSNSKPHEDEDVLKGIDFMFTHWDRLNDYLRNRIQLRDIHDKIEEILPKIKNGSDKKTAAKDDLQRFKQSLTKQ